MVHARAICARIRRSYGKETCVTEGTASVARFPIRGTGQKPAPAVMSGHVLAPRVASWRRRIFTAGGELGERHGQLSACCRKRRQGRFLRRG